MPAVSMAFDLRSDSLGEAPHAPHQAALLLHAMATADQEWILNKLLPEERSRLHVLVKELESLGIPRDASLLQNVEALPGDGVQPGVKDVDALPKSDEEALYAMATAEVHVLLRCMRTEPAPLIAACLGFANWPWYQQFLDLLDPARRRRVEELMDEGRAVKVPPAFRAALIASLRERFDAEKASEVPRPSRLKAFERLWQRFTRDASRSHEGRA